MPFAKLINGRLTDDQKVDPVEIWPKGKTKGKGQRGEENGRKRYFIFRGGKICQRDRKGEGGREKAVGFCPKFRNDVSRFRLLLLLLYAPSPADNKIQ